MSHFNLPLEQASFVYPSPSSSRTSTPSSDDGFIVQHDGAPSKRRRSHGPRISLGSNGWQPMVRRNVHPHWTNRVPAPFPHQLTTPATVQCQDTTYTVKHGTSPRAPQTLPPLTSAYNFTATYALESSVRYSGTISGVGYAYKRSTLGPAYPNTQAPSQPNLPYANHHPKATPTGNFHLDLSDDGQPEAILQNPPSLPASVVHSRGGKEVFRIWNANHGAHPTQSTSDLKSTTSEALTPQLPSQIGPIKKPRKSRQKSPKNGAPPQYTEEECKLYPFKCDECGIRMGRKQDMETHQLSHVEKTERKSVCPYAGCGKRLSRPDALKRHMTLVHPLA